MDNVQVGVDDGLVEKCTDQHTDKNVSSWYTKNVIQINFDGNN